VSEDRLHHMIADELGIRLRQVNSAVELFDEGNTIPFVARYRKEATGTLDEEQLRQVKERLEYLRKLEDRRETIIASIEKQEKMTPELQKRLSQAESLQAIEDLYLPYRPKRRTRATIAKERGLAPLAKTILAQEMISGRPKDHAAEYVTDDVPTADDALAGARDIIAERIAEDADARSALRRLVSRSGALHSKKKANDPQGKYQDYYDYEQSVATAPPHRVLALDRGEAEGVIQVSLDIDEAPYISWLEDRLIRRHSIFEGQLGTAVRDAFARLLFPSAAREIRSALTDQAQAHAIRVFGTNLRALLLQAPLQGKRILGIDPGYRTGSKVTVIDETGKVLATETIYPHPPQKRWQESKTLLVGLVGAFAVDVIAIGNGTASRETEQLASEVIAEARGAVFTIVSEAGASVYSASRLAAKELPGMDVSMRGAVSIARRLQDPLAEMVKVDPRSIGVGLYQHDVDQKALSEALDAVVESAVNHVGVNVNTASPALLRYVSGLNARTAERIVAYRDETGPFGSRASLKKVKGIGAKTFEQAAGFLRIPQGRNPLDATFIHPESYSACQNLLQMMGLNSLPSDSEAIAQAWQRLLARDKRTNDIAKRLGVGVPTMEDMVQSLQKRGLDPRTELPPPMLRTDVLKIEDLQEGMVLKGTVRNVVDFGAFVDIGVKQDGLVHISEMSDHYVRDPLDVVSVNDIIAVRVLGVDLARGRVSLSMRE